MPITLKTRNSKLETRNLLGFSLIELMVVITLFTITTIAVTTSYISFQGREILKNAALQLKTDLRLAQNSAQTGDKVSDTNTSPSACSSTVSPAGTLVGWYVVLGQNTSSYTIAGDCLTTAEMGFASKTVNLPSDVTISNITYGTGVGSSKTNVVILFKPLDYSVTYFDEGDIPNTWPGNLPDFLDDATGSLRTSSLIGVTPDELVVRVHSTDGDYDIKITGSGEINETKI